MTSRTTRLPPFSSEYQQQPNVSSLKSSGSPFSLAVDVPIKRSYPAIDSSRITYHNERFRVQNLLDGLKVFINNHPETNLSPPTETTLYYRSNELTSFLFQFDSGTKLVRCAENGFTSLDAELAEGKPFLAHKFSIDPFKSPASKEQHPFLIPLKEQPLFPISFLGLECTLKSGDTDALTIKFDAQKNTDPSNRITIVPLSSGLSEQKISELLEALRDSILAAHYRPLV